MPSSHSASVSSTSRTKACRCTIRLDMMRSEEHTSELQSLTNLVCRLLLEKKKTKHKNRATLLRTTAERGETNTAQYPTAHSNIDEGQAFKLSILRRPHIRRRRSHLSTGKL